MGGLGSVLNTVRFVHSASPLLSFSSSSSSSSPPACVCVSAVSSFSFFFLFSFFCYLSSSSLLFLHIFLLFPRVFIILSLPCIFSLSRPFVSAHVLVFLRSFCFCFVFFFFFLFCFFFFCFFCFFFDHSDVLQKRVASNEQRIQQIKSDALASARDQLDAQSKQTLTQRHEV